MDRPTYLIEALKTGTLHGPIPAGTTYRLLEWIQYLEKKSSALELLRRLELAEEALRKVQFFTDEMGYDDPGDIAREYLVKRG